MKTQLATALIVPITISALGIGTVSANAQEFEAMGKKAAIASYVNLEERSQNFQNMHRQNQGPRIDFVKIAETLEMTEDELKEELLANREAGKNLFDYLSEKGLSEEEIKELIPKNNNDNGNGNGQNRPKIDFNKIAEMLGLTEDELKEELLANREAGKNLFDYLSEKGLSEEEIKELLPKRGNGQKPDLSKVAEALDMTEEELIEEFKNSGMKPVEYLKSKGMSEEEIKELLPKRGNGHRAKPDLSKVAEALDMTEEELIEEFKNSDMNPVEYLKSKGFSEEEIKELLPKRGNRHGQKPDLSKVAEALDMTEEELIEEFKSSEMNPIEYLKSKGLSEEEIKEMLPPPPNGERGQRGPRSGDDQDGERRGPGNGQGRRGGFGNGQGGQRGPGN